MVSENRRQHHRAMAEVGDRSRRTGVPNRRRKAHVLNRRTVEIYRHATYSYSWGGAIRISGISAKRWQNSMNINDNPTVNAILAAERITEGTHGRDNTSLFDPIWSPAMWERARISRHTASSAAFSSGVTSGRRRRLEVGGMAPSYRRADSLRTALTNPTTLICKGSRHDLPNHRELQAIPDDRGRISFKDTYIRSRAKRVKHPRGHRRVGTWRRYPSGGRPYLGSAGWYLSWYLRRATEETRPDQAKRASRGIPVRYRDFSRLRCSEADLSHSGTGLGGRDLCGLPGGGGVRQLCRARVLVWTFDPAIPPLDSVARHATGPMM